MRLVEYFVAVAEELHFGRAARRLHIAQPSLSQQIRLFERRLGVELLRRTSRRVELTPAGRALLVEGRRLLNDARTVTATVRSGAERITVGVFGSAAYAFLPAALRAFADQRPLVHVSVRELQLGTLDEVTSGTVDLAFTRLIPGQADLEIHVLTRERRFVALPQDHRLAGEAEVSFAAFAGEAFIVNPAVEADGPPARWLMEQRRHGLGGRVAAQATSVREIVTLVGAGQGICLVPESVVHWVPGPGVVYVPVTDAEPAVVSLAWPRGRLRRGAERFVEIAMAVAPVGSAAVADRGHSPGEGPGAQPPR